MIARTIATATHSPLIKARARSLSFSRTQKIRSRRRIASPPSSIRPPHVVDDGPPDLQRVDRARLPVNHLAARGDQEGVGHRSGPVLVEGLRELVLAVDLADEVDPRGVDLLEHLQRGF